MDAIKYNGKTDAIGAGDTFTAGFAHALSTCKDIHYGYLDQTGDIKFEANLEYRFPILGDLHGAAFLDAGNVWLIREDENRPGGQFKWRRFWKDESDPTSS